MIILLLYTHVEVCFIRTKLVYVHKAEMSWHVLLTIKRLYVSRLQLVEAQAPTVVNIEVNVQGDLFPCMVQEGIKRHFSMH